MRFAPLLLILLFFSCTHTLSKRPLSPSKKSPVARRIPANKAVTCLQDSYPFFIYSFYANELFISELKESLKTQVDPRIIATEMINLIDQKFPKRIIRELWRGTYLYKKGMVNLDFKKPQNVDDFLSRNYLQHARKINNPLDYIELIHLLKRTGLSGIRTAMILRAPIYYTQSIAHQAPSFIQTIINTIKKNQRIENIDILPRMALAINILNKIDLADNFAKIDSPYNFLKAMQIILEDYPAHKKYIADLAASPFVTRMNFFADSAENNQSALSFILEELSKREKTTDSTDLIKILADIFPIFKKKKSLLTLDTSDREIKVVEIKNQCAWRSCWMHTAISQLEIDLSQQLGKDIPLEVNYNYIQFLRSQFKTNIGQGIAKIEQGGQASEFFFRAQIDGVIPSSVWRPRFILEGNDYPEMRRKIIEELNSITTKEFLAQQDIVNRVDLQLNYADIVDEILEKYVGKMPLSFKFAGKSFTPQSFAQYFFPDMKLPYTHLYKNAPVKYKDYQVVHQFINVQQPLAKFSQKISMHYQSLNMIKKTIISQINKERPVYLAFKIPNRKLYNFQQKVFFYINNKTGKITAFSDILEGSAGVHATLIVGYELDAQGNLVSLKLQNSWGENMGDRGFYQMHISFFEKYFVNLILKKNQLLSE